MIIRIMIAILFLSMPAMASDQYYRYGGLELPQNYKMYETQYPDYDHDAVGDYMIIRRHEHLMYELTDDLNRAIDLNSEEFGWMLEDQ